jgi:hypothetical protein
MGRAFRILEDNLLHQAKGEEMINMIKSVEARHTT